MGILARVTGIEFMQSRMRRGGAKAMRPADGLEPGWLPYPHAFSGLGEKGLASGFVAGA